MIAPRSFKFWLAVFTAFVHIAVVAGAINCGVEEPPPQSPIRAGKGPYVYKRGAPNGPARWGLIPCPNYATCGTGQMQSPINIKKAQRVEMPKRLRPQIIPGSPVLEYEATANNFEFKCISGQCGELRYRGTTFEFDQIHFHSPSEHKIAGKSFPLEAHLVHKSSGGSNAVFAVLISVGQFNPYFQALLATAVNRGTTTFNMAAFLQAVTDAPRLLTYSGSLTTPPCTEGIQWIVSLRGLAVSRSQLLTFRSLVGGKKTNRPIQPRNGRLIRYYPH